MYKYPCRYKAAKMSVMGWFSFSKADNEEIEKIDREITKAEEAIKKLDKQTQSLREELNSLECQNVAIDFEIEVINREVDKIRGLMK